jgi:hypothetical protein
MLCLSLGHRVFLLRRQGAQGRARKSGVGARGIARMLAPLRRAKRSAESWNVRGVEFTNGDVPGVRLRSRS